MERFNRAGVATPAAEYRPINRDVPPSPPDSRPPTTPRRRTGAQSRSRVPYSFQGQAAAGEVEPRPTGWKPVASPLRLLRRGVRSPSGRIRTSRSLCSQGRTGWPGCPTLGRLRSPAARRDALDGPDRESNPRTPACKAGVIPFRRRAPRRCPSRPPEQGSVERQEEGRPTGSAAVRAAGGRPRRAAGFGNGSFGDAVSFHCEVCRKTHRPDHLTGGGISSGY